MVSPLAVLGARDDLDALALLEGGLQPLRVRERELEEEAKSELNLKGCDLDDPGISRDVYETRKVVRNPGK